MMRTRALFSLVAGLMLIIGVLSCGGDGGGSSKTPSFTIGGTVTGLSGDLTLQCNGTDDLVVIEDGTFTFETPHKKGTAYEVTIARQPTGQICGVTANGSGTIQGTKILPGMNIITGEDVTDVQVECVTADVITRVSKASDGTWGTPYSTNPSISMDGRYVAFASWASNLVPDDTNGQYDVFVHDRLTEETTRVSVASDGKEATNLCYHPAISGDGRFVTFESVSSNLVADDTNNQNDIFVHDRLTRETTRVSVASDGAEANGYNMYPSINEDGRYVAFHSDATNLVTGDTNNARDLFVHDRITGETRRVNVASDGTEADPVTFFRHDGSSISSDGRYVAFESDSTNLVAGDTNGFTDIFVHDLLTNETTRISVASDGTEANDNNRGPSISSDGRYVVFESMASNLDADSRWGGVFVHDRLTGETKKVSVASNGTEAGGYSPSISGDGRYVAFASVARNLVPGDTNFLGDVFVHDRLTGETTRVSVAWDGAEGNGESLTPYISGDGRYVAFESQASNLVPRDNNSGLYEIYVAPVQ